MFAYALVKSFEVERDGQHVLMTCHDPCEDQDVVVRVTKEQLNFMHGAEPVAGMPGLPQTPTDFARVLPS
jgi:hypothetical protein